MAGDECCAWRAAQGKGMPSNQQQHSATVSNLQMRILPAVDCADHPPSPPATLTSLMVRAASEADRLLRRMMASRAVPNTTLHRRRTGQGGARVRKIEAQCAAGRQLRRLRGCQVTPSCSCAYSQQRRLG